MLSTPTQMILCSTSPSRSLLITGMTKHTTIAAVGWTEPPSPRNPPSSLVQDTALQVGPGPAPMWAMRTANRLCIGTQRGQRCPRSRLQWQGRSKSHTTVVPARWRPIQRSRSCRHEPRSATRRMCAISSSPLWSVYLSTWCAALVLPTYAQNTATAAHFVSTHQQSLGFKDYFWG